MMRRVHLPTPEWVRGVHRMLAERPEDEVLIRCLAVIKAATPDVDGSVTVMLPEEDCEHARVHLATGHRFMDKASTFFAADPDYCNEDAKPRDGWLGMKW